ncbi:transporter [Planctomycetales bacterium]|nr:transporter [Planctomycetales bacterium]
MVAGDEELHSDRIVDIQEFGFKLLPIAAIYGGNASGKSNLIKALAFARRFILRGSQSVEEPIRTDPFRLDDESQNSPSLFEFLLLVPSKTRKGSKKNTNFECFNYSFAISKNGIETEKITQVLHPFQKPAILFDRRYGKKTRFSPAMKDSLLKSFLDTTPDNQLYLSSLIGRKTERFSSDLADKMQRIRQWFVKLLVIAPDTEFLPEGHWNLLHNTKTNYNTLLSALDTGISELDFELTEDLQLPLPIRKHLENMLSDNGSRVSVKVGGIRVCAFKKDGEIVANKIISNHLSNKTNKKVKFDLQDDSDGTVRVIDILPSFITAIQSYPYSVVIIDELDRSLHTLLVRDLLKYYMRNCKNSSRSQIIFTTHDVLQMNTKLLRNDEMWVVERKKDGASVLIPLVSYKEIKDDRNLMDSYLRGQLGGIPKILLDGIDLESNEDLDNL